MAADLTGSIPAKLEQLFGSSTDSTIRVKAITRTVTGNVAVPSITDPDIAKVDVTISGLALGDAPLVVAPTTALPTNCRYQGAYVSATDTLSLVFGSEGGNVVGANRVFNIITLDLT